MKHISVLATHLEIFVNRYFHNLALNQNVDYCEFAILIDIKDRFG